MTEKELEKLKGFGVERTAREWADLLGISIGHFLYCIHTEEMTVEGLYVFRGIKYRAPKPPKPPKPPKQRKPRESPMMGQTKERMRLLLYVSGYDDEADLYTVEVRTANHKGEHAVFYLGELIGIYTYRTCILKLTSGQGLPLLKLPQEQTKIYRKKNGVWDIHPDTHLLLIRQITQRAKME